MKSRISISAFILWIAFAASTTAFGQKETKVKIERDNYELKIKQDGNEFKMKEEGIRPAEKMQKQTTILKEGETVIMVKKGETPKQEVAQAKKPVATKKTYAARKDCPPQKIAVKSTTAKKRTTAYKPKTTSTVKPAMAQTKPVIIRDTIFVTRVDTLFSITQTSEYAGYSRNRFRLNDDFEKLKIERESDGTIKLKKEYKDGSKDVKIFENEEDFQTYIEWKNF